MADSEAPSLWLQVALAAALAGVPPLVGVAAVLLGDESAPGAVLLASEPAWWVGALSVLFGAGVKRSHLGAAALGGVALQAALLRLPVQATPPRPADARVVAHAERCEPHVSAPEGRVRVAHWSAVAGVRPDELAALNADLWVITDLPDPEQASAFGRPVGAPVQHSPEGGGVAILVPGGSFRACGRADREQIALPVPPGAPDPGVALLAHPELPDGRVLPVVAFNLPFPKESAPRYGEWIASAADWTATLAAAAGPAVVLTGTSTTHSTSRGFLGRFSGAGLLAAPSQATWPAALGPLPAPALYHRDRAWHGHGWQVVQATTHRVGGAHLAYVLEVEARASATATR